MPELERFMDALPGEWRLFVLLLAHTGLRIGEMLGLRWGDVHLGDDPGLTVDDQVYQGERKQLKNRERLPDDPVVVRHGTGAGGVA